MPFGICGAVTVGSGGGCSHAGNCGVGRGGEVEEEEGWLGSGCCGCSKGAKGGGCVCDIELMDVPI